MRESQHLSGSRSASSLPFLRSSARSSLSIDSVVCCSHLMQPASGNVSAVLVHVRERLVDDRAMSVLRTAKCR